MGFSTDERIKLRAMAKRIRQKALEMALYTGSRGAHISGSLSCVEIYALLYTKILRLDKSDWANRDRFYAGKEHARLAEFPAMAEAGLFPFEYLEDFEGDAGPLTGHPIDYDIGLEYCSCSLGMALPFAVGKAIYAKDTKKPYKVYTILGDGESTEGSIWESVTTAARYKLDNLTVIVDMNHMSVDGNTEELMAVGDIGGKFKAFGWETVYCDGHDYDELYEAFMAENNGKPKVIIADTVKGKGVSFIENNKSWHQAVISEEQFKTAYAEVSSEEDA